MVDEDGAQRWLPVFAAMRAAAAIRSGSGGLLPPQGPVRAQQEVACRVRSTGGVRAVLLLAGLSLHCPPLRRLSPHTVVTVGVVQQHVQHPRVAEQHFWVHAPPAAPAAIRALCALSEQACALHPHHHCALGAAQLVGALALVLLQRGAAPALALAFVPAPGG